MKYDISVSDEGDDCVEGRPGQSLPNVMCKPGTECVQGICRNSK